MSIIVDTNVVIAHIRADMRRDALEIAAACMNQKELSMSEVESHLSCCDACKRKWNFVIMPKLMVLSLLSCYR